MNEYITQLHILNAKIADIQSVNSHVIETRGKAKRGKAKRGSNKFKDLKIIDLSNEDAQIKIATILNPLKKQRDNLIKYLNTN